VNAALLENNAQLAPSFRAGISQSAGNARRGRAHWNQRFHFQSEGIFLCSDCKMAATIQDYALRNASRLESILF